MVITDSSTARRPDPFVDLDAYLGLPRQAGLWMSPDGRRLVVGVATLDHTKSRLTTALWDVDPNGVRPARRLTHSAEGESDAAFTPEGDLLFLSARPRPGVTDDDGDKVPALWCQPASGGDAVVLADPPGGVRGVVVSASGTVVLGTSMVPSATDAAQDKEIRTKRKDAAVSVVLHEEYPVRYWDHVLGPDRTRLCVASLSGEQRLAPRDLTGHVGNALDDEGTWDISPDGRTIVTMWTSQETGGSERRVVVTIDTVTGQRRLLAGDPEHEYEQPRISADGTTVALIEHRRMSAVDPGDCWVAVVPLAGGEIRPLTQEWDRWPTSLRWAPDGASIVVTADHEGRAPLWRVDAATGEVARLTPDAAAYSDVHVSPNGWVYAMRNALDSPPAPVRVALDGSTGPQPLPSPCDALGVTFEPPGRLEEVSTTGADGTPVRGWLALPRQAGADTPVPLLLQIHGGPVMSANVWSWRWNPWLLVSHGYAVLMPDFALSTGYGVDFVRRGWGSWGDAPYTDLMAITDTAQERSDIDPTRSAALGASFGGYMANWIAGHTDRFDCIVTHASVWNLDQCNRTGDMSYYFCREMPFEVADANSPHHSADAITTPMLVIHGDKDFRVPVSEAMRLWWDLSARSTTQDGSAPHKFLHFPDENHWILAPNHAKVWHATIRAFLAHHVLGEKWQRPELLG